MSYHKKVNAVALLLRLRIEIIQTVVYFVGTAIGRPRFTGQILGGRPMAVPTIFMLWNAFPEFYQGYR